MLQAVIQSRLVRTVKAEVGINILNRISANVRSSVIEGEYKPYIGEYSATPSFEQQVLKTKYLAMADDVTILPIPVKRFVNQYHGETVIIG